MPVLYRKYRPQTFAELTGQEHIKKILERQVAKAKIGHAYLFTGPRGVGKTSTARIFAKAINCTDRKKGSGEPCTKCGPCVEVLSGRSLDVIEIDAASHTGVDTVRETIIDTARFAPSRLIYKVFIIDEVHMLSNAAWNALLKILEEPPAHVIFVLATTEAHKIPATILSRCSRFDFKRIKIPEMMERLALIGTKEKVTIDPGVLASVARLSEGGLRDAESLLEQLLTLGEKEITEEVASLVLPVSSLPRALAILTALSFYQTKKAIGAVHQSYEEGFDLFHITQDMVELLRQGLLVKVGDEQGAADLDPESKKTLLNIVGTLSVSRLLWMIDVLRRRLLELKHATIPPLPLELAVVEIGMGESGEDRGGEPVVPSASDLGEEKVDTIKVDPTESKKVSVSESEPEAKNTSNGKGHGLEAIQKSWQSILGILGETNPSLPFILHGSEPIRLENGILTVGVRYPLHRDKLNEDKNRRLLGDLIARDVGVNVMVEGTVMIPKISDNLVDQIVEAFGGRVVE